jgi:hypothetical protein
MPVFTSMLCEEVDWVAWPGSVSFGTDSAFEEVGKAPPSRLRETYPVS